MTKYRKLKKAVANRIADIIWLGNMGHERIHRTLKRIEYYNVIIWQKCGLWWTDVYARFIPRNGNGEDDQ